MERLEELPSGWGRIGESAVGKGIARQKITELVVNVRHRRPLDRDERCTREEREEPDQNDRQLLPPADATHPSRQASAAATR